MSSHVSPMPNKKAQKKRGCNTRQEYWEGEELETLAVKVSFLSKAP